MDGQSKEKEKIEFNSIEEILEFYTQYLVYHIDKGNHIMQYDFTNSDVLQASQLKRIADNLESIAGLLADIRDAVEPPTAFL